MLKSSLIFFFKKCFSRLEGTFVSRARGPPKLFLQSIVWNLRSLFEVNIEMKIQGVILEFLPCRDLELCIEYAYDTVNCFKRNLIATKTVQWTHSCCMKTCYLQNIVLQWDSRNFCTVFLEFRVTRGLMSMHEFEACCFHFQNGYRFFNLAR